jgi:hypothetical protein
MQEITIEREEQHKEFLARGIEHEEALEAIDESLGLLDSLNNGYSLAQVKSTRSSL